MIGLSSGTRIWLAAGMTDMRRGFDGLAAIAQEKLVADPFGGHVFVFRGRRGDLIKLLWWDGDGLCLFAKRLERGRFIWPQATEGSIHLTGAQLAMLLEGIDWRRPERTWKPQKSRINSGLWGCSQRPQSRKLSPCLRPTHCPITPLCSRR